MRQSATHYIALDGNILVTEITGTIDKVMYRKMFKEVREQITPLCGAPWGNIILAEKWELSALEIDDTLIEIESWARTHNRSHLAFVVGEELAQIKRFTLEKYLGNNLKKDTVAIFSSTSLALAWLSQSGFSLTSRNSDIG